MASAPPTTYPDTTTKISCGNTIKIEGRKHLPLSFDTPRRGLLAGQFIQYEYPIHNQPSTEDALDISSARQGGSERGEPRVVIEASFKTSSIDTLDASIYPWEDIDSSSVSSIRVIELQDEPNGIMIKDQTQTEPFQRLIAEINNREGPGVRDALKLGSVREKPFGHRVSLAGALSPERLRLLVRIPSFSCGANIGTTLAQYRYAVREGTSSTANTRPPPATGSSKVISVHQSCFVVVNSEMIIMVRTASNEQSSPLPFFPGQHRVSVLHLLVHMISTLLQFSAQQTLSDFRDQCLSFNSRISKFTEGNAGGWADALRQINIKLSIMLADINSIIHLIDTQIQALEELNRIVESGYHHCLPHNSGYHANRVKLPCRLQGKRSLKIVLEELQMAITERKDYQNEFKALCGESRKSQNCLLLLLQSQETPAELQRTEIAERQAKIADEQRVIAKQQAQTMSMFTVVTTLFLPLTFFTSLFALEPGKKFVTENSWGRFWGVATPITIVFFTVTLYIVLYKKLRSGEDHWVLNWVLKNLRRRNSSPSLGNLQP